MRRLILIRHAKSDWGDPRLQDHDRPLNARGRRAAPAIGRWLRRSGYVPAEVYVSTALRARQTVEGIREGLQEAPPVRLVERLYEAAPETIIGVIGTASSSPLLLVGHNPGLATAAGRLATELPPHPDASRFPTGATLVLDFEIDTWGAIRPGSGLLVDFIVPRELGRSQ